MLLCTGKGKNMGRRELTATWIGFLLGFMVSMLFAGVMWKATIVHLRQRIEEVEIKAKLQELEILRGNIR